MAFSEFWFGQSAHFFYCVSKDFFSIRHVQTYFELHPACLTLGYLSGRLLYPTPPSISKRRRIVSQKSFSTLVSYKYETS